MTIKDEEQTINEIRELLNAHQIARAHRVMDESKIAPTHPFIDIQTIVRMAGNCS